MRTARGSLIVFTLVAGLGGCQEPFSNEDILFLKALPRDLEIDVPDEEDRLGRGLLPAQTMPTELARFYTDMVRTSTEVNEAIFGVLEIVEEVTRMPATVRDDHRRAWGPFQPEEEDPVEVLLVVDRVFTSSVPIMMFTAESEPLAVEEYYQYGVNLRPVGTSTWTPVITGQTVLLDADEDEATGRLCIDFERVRRFNAEEKARGIICIGYDFRGPREIIEVSAETEDAARVDLNFDVVWTYLRREDGSGRFFYSINGNFPETPTPARETWTATVRWVPSLAGRADVGVEGGDLAPERYFVQECWNPSFVQVYYLQNVPPGRRSGSLSNCAEGLRSPTVGGGD